MGFAASACRLDGSDLYAAAGLAENPTISHRLDSIRANILLCELRQAKWSPQLLLRDARMWRV
jgi:hypothetical protein